MKRNNIITWIALPVLVAGLSIAGWYAIAQEVAGDDEGGKKVTVKVKVTENGNTTETVKEIGLEEGQDIETVLRDMGVFDSIHAAGGENIEITIRSGADKGKRRHCSGACSKSCCSKAGVSEEDISIGMVPHIQMIRRHIGEADWDKIGSELEEKIKSYDWKGLEKRIEEKMSGEDWEEFGKELEEHLRSAGKTLERHFGSDRAMLGVQGGDAGDKKDGVKITKVHEGSAAAEMGLKEGDVVYEVNDKTVNDFSMLANVIGSMKAGDAVKVEIGRDGKKMKRNGRLKSRAESIPEARAYSYAYRTAPEGKDLRISIRIEDVTKADELKLKDKASVQAESSLKLNSMLFVPNPSDGRFDLKFDLPEKGTANIRVFDGSGRRVYDETLHDFSGAYSQSIDISAEPDGIYFVTIEQNGKKLSKKVVVQR